MADPPLYPAIREDSGEGSPPGAPRWVKVFGIVALVLVVLVILMFAGVFGESHGPGRHMGGARGAMPHENTGSVDGPADADAATRTIEMRTLDTMAFEPARINVSAGETVTFSVTNTGQAVHEFTLGDAAMQQQHAEAMTHMSAGMVHDSPNSITMRPGETKLLTWRFGGAGTLEYACHQPGHYQAGMRGQITIP